jgi:hypothetical protein
MRVELEQLRPEMVLAADIVDGAGRLLLPKATVLTEKHLRYCQMWGIADAEIQSDETTEFEIQVVDPVALAAAEDRARPRFRHTDPSHPVIAALFRYCAEASARASATRHAPAS